jgi:cold shock CspA family protein
MGLFSKKKDATVEPETPVAATGKINGLTKLKRRGFILDAETQQSIFFNAEACSDFETLSIGQNVAFKRERDPLDRLRQHAIEVRPA